MAQTACTTATYGNCAVRSYPLPSPDFIAVDAGTVTVTGDLRTATVLWNGTSYDKDESLTQGLFTAGSSVTFDSTGSVDVPMFSDSVVAPSQVDVTAPSFTEPVIVDRSQDLAFVWSGGASGTYLIDIEAVANNNSTEGTQVLCSFDAATGSGLIPSEVLSHLPATTLAGIITQVEATKTIVAGQYDVELVLAVPATATESDQGYAIALGSGAVIIQ